IDVGDVLQLTGFDRRDTRGVRTTGSFMRTGRVLLRASTARFGENPFENCQLFSIDPWGGGLLQLTHFDERVRAAGGCSFGTSPGCTMVEVYQDPVTRWIIFYSTCHPFDSSFHGSQVFAMRPDGRRLRQLTHTTGARRSGDKVYVEIPGPIAYPFPIR